MKNGTVVKMSLRCVFTQEEMREIATELAQKHKEAIEIEEDKRRVMSDYKARIDTVKARMNKLAVNYDSGYELRDIDCRVDYNYKTNKKTYTRMDTLKIVREQDISPEEMQTSFGEDS